MDENSKRRRGPKGGRERFQLVIPADVLEEVKGLAAAENRSISNMLATLVVEAIKARKGRKDQPQGNSLPVVRAAA